MKRVRVLLALLITLFIDAAAFADTNVSGNIGTNTTWTVAGSPYILSGNVTVGGPAAPTLTIQAGVVVKGNSGSQLLVDWADRGALVANGTAAAPIVFTANGSTTPGFWYGVRFGPVAGAPASSMSYATVEYAGSNSYGLGGITVYVGSPSLDHVTSRLHQHAGIRIDNATPSITASTARDNAGYGIYLGTGGGATLTDVALIANSGTAVSAAATAPLASMTGISATGNGANVIEYRGGTITENRTWKTCAIPYVATGTIYVEASTAPILTIEQGNTIRFNGGAQIAVNYNNKGGLQVSGTVSAPVVFTSNGPSTPGHWLGLFFGNIAGGPQNNISHATIEYGGSSGYQRGGITVEGLSPIFDSVTLRSNAYAGAVLKGGSLTLRNATVSANSGTGMYASGGTGLTLTSVAFTNNAGYAASLPVSVALADASNLTATGNGTGRDAIEYRGGTITANTAWPLSTIPYVVTSTVYVEGASAPALTIAAGNTVRFNSGAQIAVNYNNKGALQANGTAAAPILFTSNGAATAGFWLGLFFGGIPGGPQSSVSYATIEYGGSSGYQRGGMTVEGLSPVFDHVTSRSNAYAGAVLKGGSLVLRDATVSNNGGPGLYASGGTSATLTTVAFTSNTGYAASLPASLVLADASNLTATGNATGGNAIEYRGGTITANTSWPLSTIPYVVTSTIYVEGAAAPTLTIAAGNTVRFNSGAQIAVNYNNKGALQANGTAAAPIVFTSNGTLSAGFWLGLFFGSVAGGPQNNISYATIEYGGSSGYQRGGITVEGLSPVFDSVTVRSNAYAGTVLKGGSLTLRNATVSNNSGTGLYASGGTSVTLTAVAFTGNTGYAASLPASLVLGDASNLTATGNATGGNAIEYRGGTITANATWPLSTIPYVVTSTIYVEGASAPTLTIAAGNTVRFNSSAQIAVNYNNKGALQANGTAAAPILFTSNAATAAGYWLGLYFGAVAGGPPSSVSWATIEYGGSNGYQRGGMTVEGLSPIFDHLTIHDNAVAGLVAQGTATPRINNAWFFSNPQGVKQTAPAVVSAELNYWNTAAGPCLPGSCAAGQQSASSGVRYEPWLLSTPTTQQYVAQATVQDRTFSPAIAAYLTVEYWQALPGPSTMTIRNSANEAVRTFSGSHLGAVWDWNGANDFGVMQPDGTYTYEIASTYPSLPPAAIARGLAIIDSTRTLTLSNPTSSQAFFSPNKDGIQDTTLVAATTNYDHARWTVDVLNPEGTAILTREGDGTAVSLLWDGEADGKIMQLQGLHTFRVTASMGTASVEKTTTTTLDTIQPAVSIATPTVNTVLSNVYMNGGTTVTPTGSVSDVNLLNWTAQTGAGGSPTQWTNIGTGTGPVSGGNLGTWSIGNVVNGTYSMRLNAADKAGNSATTAVTPLTVGNFKVAQSAYQLNGAAGGTVTYTSTVPFPLTETIVVKNEAGAVVRNLVSSVARAAGTFQDAFNGRNDANVLLPDGPYFYVATVTDGTHTMTWDLSNDFRNDYSSYNDWLGIQAYDPFNNVPLRFTYQFNSPARVTIAMIASSGSVIGNCLQPSATFFCPVIERWEESGTHTFAWSGIDHTGGYRTIRSLGIVSSSAKFPKNAAVLFGTKPTVQNVRVTPPVFGPAVGEQLVEFDLTTYQSQSASVSVAFVNLSTLSTLRTLTVAGQPPGHRTIAWDGRADNDMLVAPGFYAVRVTVTDNLGNAVSGDILTTIKY